MDAERLPSATRIGRVRLRVNDPDRMTTFYRETIGLEVLGQDDTVTLLGNRETGLIELRTDAGAAPRPADSAGLFHTAIRFPDRQSLGDALLRVEDGWTLAGAADHGVSEAIYLSDPEGNGIELYHDRPQEDWKTDQAGNVRMPSRSLDLEGLRAAAGGQDRVPPETDIGHVHLEVTDLETARRFFVDTLGMNVRQELETALFLAAGDYHHHIGINTWNRRSAPVSGRGLDRFSLRVPDAATMDQIVERCRSTDHPVNEKDDGDMVEGPDGIALLVRTGSGAHDATGG